ncbi:protein-tyrosine-phosphatase [Chryseolinea sp. Jin1]|uniref:Protein-tyrosine-phosphatase n=1 Tax=Chryseolinea lacunae TaxID=2801331 RepID=A0ABS1KZR0_9BACT|nr:protein-tyrosine-phosphatase [Chryseolinea lacunae]
MEALVKNFNTIPDSRKAILKQLTDFVGDKLKKNEPIALIFICTHNSRRSHISQIWAQTAAAYYGIGNVVSYSGGTEATAFNPRAVKAMKDTGFKIIATSEGTNPVYEVSFSDEATKIVAFSKKYDSKTNPQKGFAAVMTCSHADENCPVVFGMEKRISLPYNDPKDFDDTPQEAAKYAERVREIGTEMLYAFSQVKP